MKTFRQVVTEEEGKEHLSHVWAEHPTKGWQHWSSEDSHKKAAATAVYLNGSTKIKHVVGTEKEPLKEDAASILADYKAHPKPHGYHIFDGHTQKLVGKTTNSSRASTMVDKRDLEYGASRYHRKAIWNKEDY
jgi:hypothetical protein